ncbi:MAG: cupin domain-containing protein [Hyphomicrobiales bacterium]|nr:cupin domain-containing protein [Hyphomicrobiales bacterium]
MDMAIAALTGAAGMELNPAGQRAGADQGDPQVAVKEVSNDGAISVGVWECAPGGWPVVDRGDTEVATIISGTGIVTDADGTEHPLAAGSVITLAKGWSGRWDITETLRKVYVIVK